jgi:DNA-binding response OmpR family regulator
MSNVILLVEDEPNDVILFQHAMLKAEYLLPVQVATDGQMAIDYLKGTDGFANRENFPLPSLLLLDLKLPHVPGLEVLKWIRQDAGLCTPLVILSSSENEHDIAAAYELGANAYLVKPSDTRKLYEMAKIIKDFWLTQNRPHPNTLRAQKSGKPAMDLLESVPSPPSGAKI